MAATEVDIGNSIESHIRETMMKCEMSWILSLDNKKEKEYLSFCVHQNQTHFQGFSIVAVLIVITLEVLLLVPIPIESSQIIPLNAVIFVIQILTIFFFYQLSKNQLVGLLHYISGINLIILCPTFVTVMWTLIPSSHHALCLYYISMMMSIIYVFKVRFIVVAAIEMIVCLPTWIYVATKFYDDTTTEMSIVFWTSLLLMALFTYDQERKLKCRYLCDESLIQTSQNFKSRISVLETETPDLFFSSPIDQAIQGIGDLLASPDVNIEHIRTLKYIYDCLNTSDWVSSSPIKVDSMPDDEEGKNWLINEFLAWNKFNSPGTTIVRTRSPGLNSRSSQGYSKIQIETLRTEEVLSMLELVPEYNFPIFNFQTVTEGRPLTVMSYHLIVDTGILSRLGLSLEKFHNFITAIEMSYDASLPFHNSLHATDVLHCIHYLVTNIPNSNLFTDIELLSIYFSAIIHDVDHPGVSNNFLMAINSPMSILYNDKSILENHHCSKAFGILQKPDCNFLKSLDTAQYKLFRNYVVEMVLATDLSHHFSILSTFKKRLLTPTEWSPSENFVDKLLLLQMMIKCSDVSNPTKSWPVYSEWISRINQEFYNQGDKEKELGLPISPFCNRNQDSTASCQKSFISFIVAPLFEALDSWTPLKTMIQGLSDSKSRFCIANDESRGIRSRRESRVDY